MISFPSTLFAAALVTLCGSDEAPTPLIPADDELRAAYESGQTFDAFLSAADARKELWERNYGSGEVPEEVVARARALGGTWHILAIAVDGCSDSVNTIPYVALLAEAAPNIELRIVDSSDGRAFMEARPTPDGRAATPTLVFLNDDFEDVGCWIERPTPLQEWAMGEGDDLSRGDFMDHKMSWYREDGGRSTVDEVVGILEAASRGEHVCGS